MTPTDLKAVQARLTQLGYVVSPTGVNDAATLAAVKRFQAASKLTVDGIVGPNTLKALGLTLTGSTSTGSSSTGSSSKAADIKLLQARLAVPQTGVLDAVTTAAVKAFQKTKGLTVDGIVGPKTLAALGLAASLVTSTMGNASAGKASIDQEAYAIARRADPKLSEAVLQYCLAVSRGEGFYGRGWANPSAKTVEESKSVGLTGLEGVGSNNWGAIQGTGSAGSFKHIDHDATGKMYVANYKRYTTPEEGFLDVCKVITKGGKRGSEGAAELNAALTAGNLTDAVNAQYANGYFELNPALYLESLLKNYQALQSATGWKAVLAQNGMGVGLGTIAVLGLAGYLSMSWLKTHA